MSYQHADEAQCIQQAGAIALLIEPRAADLGEFTVRRALPSRERRMVGPFVFFDHMGPAEFPPGKGIAVRPHPHIGIATITYLFEGEIMHRDSLGVVQPIQAGAVNLMVAGSGIVHSERAGTTLTLPDGVEELALYVAVGTVSIDESTVAAGAMAVACPGRGLTLRALTSSRVIVIGGANIGERYIEWNFVSDSSERIERARFDWREGRFPGVPGDDEFIPLPD